MGSAIGEGAGFWGRISVNGTVAEYRAKVIDWIIRIGTIYPFHWYEKTFKV
jgi:hypothetical protein